MRKRRAKPFSLFGYGLYYGNDPDAGGKSLYLWNYKKKRMKCKLIERPFMQADERPMG